MRTANFRQNKHVCLQRIFNAFQCDFNAFQWSSNAFQWIFNGFQWSFNTFQCISMRFIRWSNSLTHRFTFTQSLTVNSLHWVSIGWRNSSALSGYSNQRQFYHAIVISDFHWTCVEDCYVEVPYDCVYSYDSVTFKFGTSDFDNLGHRYPFNGLH